MTPVGPCLDENAIAALLEGRLPADQMEAVQKHLDGCPTCLGVVAGTAGAPGPRAERLGRYVLESRLATGGMAEVFLARQTGPEGFEKRCVVKRLLPSMSANPNIRQRFLIEARMAAQLDHSNIAGVIDFGEADGDYFLAMEYVPGATLSRVVASLRERRAFIPYPVVARIVSQVAAGLGYAHAAVGTDGQPLRIIHRDVSPQNVMVSRTGVAKLVDFGIAHTAIAAPTTGVGMILGKAPYMSPEQALGAPLDARSDIFSLGLVFYEMLCNRRANDGKGDVQQLAVAARASFAPIERRRPGVPEPLQKVLERCLRRDATERYASAAEISEELERYLVQSGEVVNPDELTALVPVAALPSGGESLTALVAGGTRTLMVGLPRTLRRRWPVAVAAGAILISGGLALRLAFHAPPPEPPRPPVVAAAPVIEPAPQPAKVPEPAPAIDPSPKPPRAASTVGILVVHSSVKLNAFVDGKAVGATPLLAKLSPGRHQLLLKNERFGLSQARQVSVEAGRTHTEEWNPAKGTLTFRVIPYAEISLQHRSVGVTPLPPMSLWEGHYTLELVNPDNNRHVSREVDVQPGAETVVKADLR
jgi:serine/threonine-protein kinase